MLDSVHRSALNSSAKALHETPLHDGPITQAAAYLFHLCGNHPFADGNKRVALAAALVFLDLHGIEVYDRNDELYELVMAIARSEIGKEEIAPRLAALCTPPTGAAHPT